MTRPFSRFDWAKCSSASFKRTISKIRKTQIDHKRLELILCHFSKFFTSWLRKVSVMQRKRHIARRPSCPKIVGGIRFSFCFREEKLEQQFGRSSARFFQLGSQTANQVCSSFRLRHFFLFPSLPR